MELEKKAYRILAARPGRVYIGHGYGEAHPRYPMAAIVAPSPEEALRIVVEWLDISEEEKSFIRAVGAGLDPLHADERQFSSKLPAEMRFLRVEVKDAEEKYLDNVYYGTLVPSVCDYYAIHRHGAFRPGEGHWVDEKHEVFRLTVPVVGVAYNCGRWGFDVLPGLYKQGYHGSPGAAGEWIVIGE